MTRDITDGNAAGHEGGRNVDRDALVQELWEYHYGCHEAPDAIERRLANDAELRALFEQVRTQTNVVDAAAVTNAPGVEWRVPTATSETSKLMSNAGAAPVETLVAKSPRPWGLGRVAAAAVLVICLGSFAYWAVVAKRTEDAMNTVARLVVTTPSVIPHGTTSSFHIETWDVDGNATTESVAWHLEDEAGRQIASGTSVVDGEADVAVPASLEEVTTLVVRTPNNDVTEDVRLKLHPHRVSPLVHLSSDRPVYRPAETTRFRAVYLDRLRLEPRNALYRLRLLGPKGTELARFDGASRDGVMAPEWRIPAEATGGTYALVLKSGDDAYELARHEFVVRRYEPPMLKKKIDLDRETYAPGAKGFAEVVCERLAGGIPAGAMIQASVSVDGSSVWSATATADAEGRATFAFEIPTDVDRGDGRFVAAVRDGGVVETEIEPFQVPTGKVDVALFPEGGELAANRTNRVYVEITDPLGRAVSGRGDVRDATGKIVTEFETTHQGRGTFDIEPATGTTYRLHLAEPSAKIVELPAAFAEAVALRTRATSCLGGEPLALSVTTPGAGPWTIGVFCRGLLLGQDTVPTKGAHDLAIALPAEATGVLRVTVFDPSMTAVAERLVHRESSRRVEIAMAFAKDEVTPGETQKLTVETKDEAGRPVANAVVGVSVTDRAVDDMVGEERIGLEDALRLTADVEELEDVGEFLVRDDVGRERIDLLLGTRGWRRFAWQDADASVEAQGDAARRLVARDGVGAAPRVADTLAAVQPIWTETEAKRQIAKRNGAQALFGLLAVGIAIVLLWVLRRDGSGAVVFQRMAAGTVAALVLILGVWITNRRHQPERISVSASTLSTRILAEVDVFGATVDVWGRPIPVASTIDNHAAKTGAPAQFGAANRHVWVGGAMEGIEDIQKDAPGAPVLAAMQIVEKAKADVQLVPKVDDVRRFWKDAMDRNDVLVDRLAQEPKLLGAAAAVRRVVAGRPGLFDHRNKKVHGLHGRRLYAQFRVYAHKHRAGTNGRADQTETLFWNPVLRTDAAGRAEVSFAASDRVTTWIARADAHGASRVGQGTATFEANLPLAIEAKLPVEATKGDRIDIPVSVVCRAEDVTEATVTITTSGPMTSRLAARETTVRLVDGRGRVTVPVEVTASVAFATFRAEAKAGEWTDAIERKLRVVERGFPHLVARSGSLTADTEFDVALPAAMTPGTLRSEIVLYPSVLSTIVEGMEGLLREPHGCFEQASSTNYPNVLALAFMEGTGSNAPAVAKRARRLLDKGYKKLTGYECGKKGYEWFGKDPGHEALSAYGLLEFHDMAKVYAQVDGKMVERTRQWLLDRRDGKGGFRRNKKGLDSFGRAPQETTDAYITYALAATGTDPEMIETEIERLREQSLESADAYVVAVAACALHSVGRHDAADAARERLKTMQREDGALVGTATITNSGERDRSVETTSFAVLAWLVDEDDRALVGRATRFLLSRRTNGGRFGATQATIMALKALCACAEAEANERASRTAGTVRLLIDDAVVGEVPLRADSVRPIRFTDLGRHLKVGANRVRLESTASGDTGIPWLFDLAYHSDQPASDSNRSLDLDVSFAGGARVREGETVSFRVTMTNRTDTGVAMPMAIVGLPAGLEVPTDVLDDLEKAGRFALWEIRGRELIFYWRGLAPSASHEFVLDAVARVPGVTAGPASRAYPYYSPREKAWAAPLEVEVVE